MSEGTLGRIYRRVCTSGPVRALVARAVSTDRLAAGYTGLASAAEPAAGMKVVWFHAASVGELESLWPVIRLWVNGGGKVILTIFSESAHGALGRLVAELRAKTADRLVFSGYSPLEGAWREALKALNPDVFVTSKYECWPDLWAALAEIGTPLVVTGAMPRRSLRVAAFASRVLQGKVPRLRFLCSTVEDAGALEREFPGSHVEVCGDPRWDRVRERAAVGSPRARTLVEDFGAGGLLPRPWGVLGSAWPSDLAVWSEGLGEVRGTVWIAPHRVDAASLATIEALLKDVGRTPIRTSAGTAASAMLTAASLAPQATQKAATVLVDEMGFLLELYGAADWAYVGGGFEAGVHSTIEPAIRGIPICAGPKRAARFPEISELVEDGQLTLVSGARQLSEWLATRGLSARAESAASSWQGCGDVETPGHDRRPGSERERWLKSCGHRFGASAAVLLAIEAALHEES